MALVCGALIQYDFTAPVLNAAFAATLLRWVMLGLIIVGAAWGLKGLYDWVGRRFGSTAGPPTPGPAPEAAEPAISQT